MPQGLQSVPEAVLAEAYLPQIRIRIEGTLKFLRIDLAVLVENVSIDLCDHIYLCMSCIALCGLQIAVVEFQLVSRTGMSQRVKDDVREPCLLFQQ